jgi:hypothetical protein
MCVKYSKFKKFNIRYVTVLDLRVPLFYSFLTLLNTLNLNSIHNIHNIFTSSRIVHRAVLFTRILLYIRPTKRRVYILRYPEDCKCQEKRYIFFFIAVQCVKRKNVYHNFITYISLPTKCMSI